MAVERERGISVSSAVMSFEHEGLAFNLARHAGPPDFSPLGFQRGHLPHPEREPIACALRALRAHRRPVRAVNAGSYLRRHPRLFPVKIGRHVGVSPAWMGGQGTEP